MAYELVYTSAPQGVYRGSSGFCVVACTKGLGPRLIAALEGYSAYKPLYPHYAENAWSNPVSRSHYIFEANGERQHILSRICFNGVDYTGRSNKLASHLVLSAAEAARAAGGPASLLLIDELFKDAAWPIEAEFYDTQREIPATAPHPGKCAEWEKATGDAGWAGYLAQCFLDRPERNVYVVYDPAQQEIVPRLFDEAINLLPADKRWEVTFNTYFVTLPAGASCAWRGVPRDGDAVRLARRSPANIVIDLARPGQLPEPGELVEYARTGVPPKPPVKEEEAPPPVAPPPTQRVKTPPKATARPEVRKAPEKTAPRVVAPVRPATVVPAAQTPRRQVPWGRIALLAAAVVVVVAAVIGAFLMWEAADRQRMIGQCVTLRRDLDSLDERRAELETEIVNAASAEALNALSAEVRGLSDTLESVREKAAALDRRRKLVEGKLAEAQTPGRILEDCGELHKVLEATENRLERRRKFLKEHADRLKAPKPAEKKTAEQPKTESDKPKAPPAAPSEKKTAAADKKLAPPDKPDLLWLRAEALYKTKGGVTLALGGAAAGEIEIQLVPDDPNSNKVYACHPGEVLKYTNESDNDVVLGTAFDPATGVLKVTVERYQLTQDRRLLVRVKNSDGKMREYPFFFKIGVSKPDLGKLKYRVSVSGARVVLNVTGTDAAVPKRIYGGGRSRALQYKLLCSGKSFRLADVSGGLICEWKDDELAKQVATGEALAKLKRKIAESPEDIIRKLDIISLSEEQRKAWNRKLERWQKLDDGVHRNLPLIVAGLKLPATASPQEVDRMLKEDKNVKKLDELRKLADKRAKGHGKKSADAKRLVKAVDEWMGNPREKKPGIYRQWKSMTESVPKAIVEELPVKSLPDAPTKSDQPLKKLMDECSARQTERVNKLKEQYQKVKFVIFYESSGKTTTVGKTELESK